MNDYPKFSCFLMGNQSRLIQCGNILLSKGHHINGVISKEIPIQNWAKEYKLHLMSPDDNIVKKLKQRPFDFFFSIDNFYKVPNEILSLPRKYPINFHDAPLPAYAGVNATNWALINRESSHGITWHVMTNQIDAGDILKQKTFQISANESAFTLNGKCYQESIKCFSELIDDFEAGRVKPLQQNLENRSYFPRWKRPPGACTIDWATSAEDILALFRGLDFGTYWNPIGLPKLFIGNGAVIIKQIDVSDTRSEKIPGTITAVDNERIYVATITREIVLGQFCSFSGAAISISQLLERAGLSINDRFPKLGDSSEHRITQIHSDIGRHEEFWKERLANLEPLEIPYSKRRISSVNPNQFQNDLEMRKMRNLCHIDVSGTPGDAIMAAFLLYLSRIGGKKNFDVNFQDESLRNSLREAEDFFASYVPLRIDVNYKLPFTEFYQDIQEHVSWAKKHGSYPRDLILRDPDLKKNFTYDFRQVTPITLKRVTHLADDEPTCVGDFTVIIPDDGQQCLFVFRRDILDLTSIDRIQEQFMVLLKDIGCTAERSIGSLSILPEVERQLLLTEWYGQNREFLQDANLAALFEHQVERSPDAEALIFKRKRLSYRQINRQANYVADRLRQLGVGPETLVGLCVERSVEMVVSILAILKAGGAYVPLDPAYPKERLAFILEDTQTTVILTQKHLSKQLFENSANVVTLEEFELESASSNSIFDQNPASGVTADNLVYVIYTSGSTGRPKGVLVTHDNVMRLMEATEAWYHFDQKDAWTLFHSFAFDFSVWEIWGALLYGGRLVIVAYEDSRSPREFYRLLVREKITVLNQTPSAFYQLIQAEGDLQPGEDLALRLVIFGGEALDLQNLKPWFARHGDKQPQLVNMYGITETTVHVTYRPITLEDVTSGLGSVIGEPIPDLQLYVLDENMLPVPVGVAGELYVGGAGLARGYLNRPELTKERFVHNPFSTRSGARLYKTGDVARFLPNRDMEYLGRADMQVQIRGFRVELGEIESILSEHDAVNQSVVVVWEDQPGDQRLVAYIVSSTEDAMDVTELRDHLQKKLPEYMIPHFFVPLESIPLTHNGKTDRRALPAPQIDRQLDKDYVAPRNGVEKDIAAIWQKLLNIRNVGTHDNFFEIGGHSLLLVRMLGELQKLFKKELSIVELFRNPTVSTLSNFITQKKESEPMFQQTFNLVDMQRKVLKRKKRVAVSREKPHG